MTLNDLQLRKYRRLRKEGEPAKYAFIVATYRPKLPEELEWLRSVGVMNYGSPEHGTYKGLDVTVEVEYDEDSRLGDDDVTGTFVDENIDGECIKNTESYGSRIQNGSDYRWYRPSVYDRQYAEEEIRKSGVPRGLVPEKLRERLEKAMRDDANRTFYGVTVKVSLDGDELGSSSVWGIDIIDDDSYLVEVAHDCLEEAFEEAKRNAYKKAASSQEHTQRILDLAESWRSEIVDDLTEIRDKLKGD